jgi:glycogen synthase
MRVLRLCSVFEPAALSGRPTGYDAIGGMPEPYRRAEAAPGPDGRGPAGPDVPAGRAGSGRGGQVVRTGADTRLARQGWALLAAPLALGGALADVVHGHCGEDIAVLPLARLAARRHRCPWSLPCTPACGTTCGSPPRRTAWLRLAGGPAERRALAAADMVIALTPARRGPPGGRGNPARPDPGDPARL